MLRTEKDGPIMRLVLDRPDKKNAMNWDMIPMPSDGDRRAAVQ